MPVLYIQVGRKDGRARRHIATPELPTLLQQCRVKRSVVYDLLQNYTRDCTPFGSVSRGLSRKKGTTRWPQRWSTNFSCLRWAKLRRDVRGDVPPPPPQGSMARRWIHCPRRIERSTTKAQPRCRDHLFDRGWSTSEVEQFVGVPGIRCDAWGSWISLRYSSGDTSVIDKSLVSRYVVVRFKQFNYQFDIVPMINSGTDDVRLTSLPCASRCVQLNALGLAWRTYGTYENFFWHVNVSVYLSKIIIIWVDILKHFWLPFTRDTTIIIIIIIIIMIIILYCTVHFTKESIRKRERERGKEK